MRFSTINLVVALITLAISGVNGDSSSSGSSSVSSSAPGSTTATSSSASQSSPTSSVSSASSSQSSSKSSKSSESSGSKSSTASSSTSGKSSSSTSSSSSSPTQPACHTFHPCKTEPEVIIVETLVTFCPGPTVFAINGKTFSASGPTTLTITDCPCTVTSQVEVPATQVVTGGVLTTSTAAIATFATGSGHKAASGGIPGFAIAIIGMLAAL